MASEGNEFVNPDPAVGGCGCDGTTGGDASGGGPIFHYNSFASFSQWGSMNWKGKLGLIMDGLIMFFMVLMVIAIVLLGARRNTDDERFAMGCGIALFVLLVLQIPLGKYGGGYDGYFKPNALPST